MAAGTSVHAGIELNYRQKTETGEDLPIEQVQQASAEAWEREAPGVLFDEDDNPGRIKDAIVAGAAAYHRTVAPKVQPLIVEESIEVVLEGVGHTLLVKPDVVTKDHVLRDTKTVKSADKRAVTTKQLAVDRGVQVSLYSGAAQVRLGHLPNRAVLDLITRHPTKSEVVSVTAIPKQEQVDRAYFTVAQVSRGIEAGQFLPAPVDSWKCTPKWCGYYQECHRQWGKTVFPVPVKTNMEGVFNGGRNGATSGDAGAEGAREEVIVLDDDAAF